MNAITQIAEEIIELYKESQSIKEKLQTKKEELDRIFIRENKSSIEIDNYKLSRIPKQEQTRLVNQEEIKEVLKKKIDDEIIIKDILDNILKHSPIKPHIKILKSKKTK